MKSRKSFGRQVRLSLSVAAAVCGLVGLRQSAEGADFIWTNGGGTSTWDNPLNWNIGSGFPDSTADTASFGASAIGVVDLNGDRKVGSLSFGGSFGGIALAVAANTLTLDNGAGGAVLNESGSRFDTISARLVSTGLVGDLTAGNLILSNVADGAGANFLAGTFTIGAGATLEVHFTGTSNAMGAMGVTLAGGSLTLENFGTAGVTAGLGNNVTVTADSTLAVSGAGANISLGTLALTSGKTLTVGSGANIAMVSTAFAPPAPNSSGPGRTFTFNVTSGSTFSLGQFIDTNAPLNGDVLTKSGGGKLVFGPSTAGQFFVTLSVAQGEAVLQSATGKSPFSGAIRLDGANTRLTYEVLSGGVSTMSRIAVADDATIAQVISAPADGQPHGGTLSGNIPVSVAGKTLTFDIGGDVMQVNGFISGTNITLAKVGNGTLNLNAANTYSGTTTIAPGGFLRLSNAKALGSSSLSLGLGQMLDVNASLTGTGAITIAPGAILRLGGVTASLGGTQLTPASIPAGTLIQLNSGNMGPLDQINPAVFYTVISPTIALGNTINLAHDGTFPLSGIFTNADTDTFISGISNSINAGNGAILASTTGRKLQLTGTVNAGTNVLTIGSVLPIDGLAKNGTVQASVTAAEIDVVSGTFFGAVTNDAPIVVRPGGTAIFNGGNSTYFLEGGNGLATFNGGAGGLAGNGNVTIGLGSTGSVVTPIIGSNNLNTRFSGVIGQDTGTNLAGIQKFGTGLLELTGQSTFLGVTNITKGTVLVSGSGRISLGDVSVGNASLRIESLGAIAPGKKVGGLLGLDAMIDPTSIVSGSGGNVVAINVDNHTIPLDQSLIGNGMVSLGSQLPATVTVLTGETTTSTATLQLPGNGTYAATSLGAGKTITPAVSAGEYWLGGGGGRLTVLNGVLVGDNEVAIQGIVSLLSPNTYTKVTAINGLLLANNGNNGSATGTGPIVIGGGGILGGNGTVSTDSAARFIDVDSGGAISPGDGGPGTLNIRSTSATHGTSFNSTVWFEGNAALIVDVNPKGNSDLINLVGTLELGTAQLSATLLSAPAFGDVIPLLKNDGTDAIGGAFSGLPEGAILGLPFGGGTYDFTISYKANLDGGSVGNDIALTAVPEPAAIGAVGAAGLFFLSGRRRRALSPYTGR